MISAWWLVLIIPVSAFLGMFTISVIAIGSGGKDKEE